MQWRFTLIDRNGIRTVIDEPNGWMEFSLRLKRHPQRHGTFREIQGNNFQFFEKAAWLLKAEYEAHGAKGYYQLLIEEMTTRGRPEAHRGIFVFPSYRFFCERDCFVEIDIDQTGPIVDFINRFDQAVDVTKTKGFDGVTELSPYAFLNFDLTLPSKTIRIRSEAATKNEEGNSFYDILFDTDFTIFPNQVTKGIILPKFNNTSLGEITDFKPSYQFDYVRYTNAISEALDGSEILLVNPDSTIINKNTYNFTARLKGSFDVSWLPHGGSGGIVIDLKVAVKYGKNAVDAIAPVSIAAYNGAFLPGSGLQSRQTAFDIPLNGSFVLGREDKVWICFLLEAGNSTNVALTPWAGLKISLTDDSFFKVSSDSKAEATTAKAFMINETISRVIESITNNKLKLYSEYFGRYNSEPYRFPANGCGSQRVLTNGLRIRQAKLPDGSVPGMFLSMKDLFESLAATDNIGLGLEGDSIVRIENWKWFYKSAVIHRCLNVNKVQRSAQASEIYSTFKFGYDKWEAEEHNGLDEFLTKREYNLDIPQVKNTLEQICKFIASGYAIEVTRRKGNSSADWRYDNNIFMICVEPTGVGFRVELGNISMAGNIIDPATVYNFRISPLRNALKWFDRVIGSYRNVNTGHRITFGSGDGNYIAEGNLNTFFCKLEVSKLKENDDLSLSVFADQRQALPIMLPERIRFSYPLGTNEYKNIQANPYGLIEFTSSCENGFGWVDQIDYKPNDGQADFTLIPQIT